MKQRKTASIIFAAGMLLLAGCQKDDLQGRGERMMLNLEAFGSGSKTVLGDDDRSLQWVSGDQVRINGVDYTVSTSGDEAYVSDVPEASSYKALFPASMAAGQSMSGTTVTATLPRQYEYRTEDGLQVLDAPLAAVGDGSAGLTFLHLTGALTVVIKNTTSNTLYIDSVVLSSAQQLCGDITVDFDNLTAVSPNTSPSNPEDTMVLLTVPYNTLSVAAGAEVKVQIPVLPVSDANRFSVHVATRYQGTRYDFDRRQGNTSNALARNEMGYVPASIATSGTHISVRPLFDYDEQFFNDYSEYSFRIYSPLDLALFAEASNTYWTFAGSEIYSHASGVRLENDLDMTGCEIVSIGAEGHDGKFAFEGGNHEISNLTVDGSGFISIGYLQMFGFTNVTFNNLVINTSGAYYLAGIVAYPDCDDLIMSRVRINGLTFNITGNSTTWQIGGIIAECGFTPSNCSVNNITINNSGSVPDQIIFGGITCWSGYGNSYFASNSYRQSVPLGLTANDEIIFGGIAGIMDGHIYEDEDEILFMSDLTVDMGNTIELRAPSIVVGGICGEAHHPDLNGTDFKVRVSGSNAVSGNVHFSGGFRGAQRIGRCIIDIAEVEPEYIGASFADESLGFTSI